MTVAELIDKLRAMPQDMRVVVDGCEGDYDDPIVHPGWAVIDESEGKYPWYLWVGRHRDVARYDEKRRNEVGAKLVIVIARPA
jgi:hypothetical protein